MIYSAVKRSEDPSAPRGKIEKGNRKAFRSCTTSWVHRALLKSVRAAQVRVAMANVGNFPTRIGQVSAQDSREWQVSDLVTFQRGQESQGHGGSPGFSTREKPGLDKQISTLDSYRKWDGGSPAWVFKRPVVKSAIRGTALVGSPAPGFCKLWMTGADTASRYSHSTHCDCNNDRLDLSFGLSG